MSWETMEVSTEEFASLKNHNLPIAPLAHFEANQGIEVRTVCGKSLNAVNDVEVGVRRINDFNPQFNNSRNRDLALYNDLLNNPEVNTVVVDGTFGTGKTSNIMAHIVEYLKTGDNPHVIFSKPHVSVGNSYGHLPGDLKTKIHHEFRSFYQYIDRFWQHGIADVLVSLGELDPDSKSYIPRDSMLYKEYSHVRLEALPFEYIRGLDFTEECWIILDETQNTNIQEVVSFASRLGDKVKFIILGDTSSAQIDRKSVVNPEKNGFAFIKSVYKDKSYSGTVYLNTRKHILRGDRVKHLFDSISSINL